MPLHVCFFLHIIFTNIKHVFGDVGRNRLLVACTWVHSSFWRDLCWSSFKF